MKNHTETMDSLKDRFHALSRKIGMLENGLDDESRKDHQKLQGRLERLMMEQEVLEEKIEEIETDYAALFATARSGAELAIKSIGEMTQ